MVLFNSVLSKVLLIIIICIIVVPGDDSRLAWAGLCTHASRQSL